MVFKLKSDQRGSHVTVTIFVGEDEDHLAHAGRVTLKLTEFQEFLAVMKEGTEACKHTLVHDYDTHETEEAVGTTMQGP
jgi:hypothetical protein